MVMECHGKIICYVWELCICDLVISQVVLRVMVKHSGDVKNWLTQRVYIYLYNRRLGTKIC